MGLGLVGGLSVLLWGQCWGSCSIPTVFGGCAPAMPPSLHAPLTLCPLPRPSTRRGRQR